MLARTDTATDKDYLDIERVIGHEYFHNWTRDRVTCRDWFQLSLKEGLTVFAIRNSALTFVPAR
ncbi:M1 family aminopeptidase [Shigella sonnei]